MIDFNNASFVKLKRVKDDVFESMITPFLVKNEKILYSFKAMRDGVVFTNFRIIAINVQGVTGKKIDFSNLPYSKVQAFSVETPGTFDLDSELELWFSGLGKVKFEFSTKSDITPIFRLIGTYALSS